MPDRTGCAPVQRRGAQWPRRAADAVLVLALLLGGGTHAPAAPAGREARSLPPEETGERPPALSAERPAIALRRALAARDAGDAARADAILAATARRHALIADHAELLRARLWLDAGKAARARAIAAETERSLPRSPLRADLFQVMAEAARSTGDEVEARRLLELAQATTEDPERRVVLGMAIAEALEEAGRLAEAAARYRDLWRDHPTEEAARDLDWRLDGLEQALGRPVRSPRDWLARADGLFRGRRSEPALQAYERALAGGLDADDRRHARWRRAHCLFRLRRYPEASAAFAALGEKRDAALWHARSLGREGDVPEAVRRLEALAARAPRELAARARYLAGLLLEGRDETARARDHYTAVAEGSRDDARVAAALWRLGWSDYKSGSYARSRRYLERMAEREADPIARLQAHYWAARAAERAGQGGAANADGREGERVPIWARELEALRRAYPFSYYGQRAAARLDGRPQAGGVQEPAALGTLDGIAPAGAARIPVGTSNLGPSDLERARILVEAGLGDAAEDELERLHGRARGLFDRLDLARLYTEVANYHRAQRLVVDAYREALARGPDPGREELWWFAWPLAYADLVQASLAADARIEPELVYSIMREESSYRPRVESSAGARGLLQIMPRTGERLASQLALPGFQPDDLFRPHINVRLGSAYLDQLAGRFAGRTSAAIGGYNAGPEAVAGWLAESPALEDDEWVENIPYPQTRAYVKRVMRSLHVYRELY